MRLLALLTALVAFPSVTTAQRPTLDLQLFQPTLATGTTFTLDRPEVPRHLTIVAGLGVNGASRLMERGDGEAIAPWRVQADLLFALDSIPAIYGLTSEPYLVFTANLFALMGLRQLYFLLGDLLNRLVFLSQGLAFILFFIGVKLVLHALHENELPFINGGEHVPVPEIPTLLSLAVIILTLFLTMVASLVKTRVVDRR